MADKKKDNSKKKNSTKKEEKKDLNLKVKEGSDAPKAAHLPLFYKQPMPLEAKKHAKLGLKKSFGYDFTKGVNAVPVNMIELPQISHFYPIAFSPDNNATPVAILGIRDNENLFVDDKGVWDAGYIPAYVRRYPFIFSETAENDRLTLCVDNNPDVLTEKDGQLFFDKDGKATELSNNAVEFCKSYHAAAQQTQEFSKALAASGILVDREVQINIPGGQRINFSGFRIIDEQKLNEMPEKDFVEWRKKGWLPFVYAHMFSGAQWQNLARLLDHRMKKAA